MILEGSYVILSSEKGKKWMVKIIRGEKFSTDIGIIEFDDLLEKDYGDYVFTSMGEKIWIVKPSLYDYILKTKRKTQIVYPKDIGYMIIKLGIEPNSKVLEIGTGSGAFTTSLAWFLSEDGVVDTYEKRGEFIKLAKENVYRIKTRANIRFYNEDVLKAEFKREFYDVAFIDIDSPWLIIDKVYNALKSSGRIGVLLPTYNQVDKLLPSLKDRFIDVEGVEVFKRELQLLRGKIRPVFRMIGFTVVLITGVKILKRYKEEDR